MKHPPSPVPAPADGLLPCRVGGVELALHPSGAVWHAASRSLIVADLHLEKAASFARFGQMLPPYETLDTLQRLARLVGSCEPASLFLLGDSFHSAHHTLEDQPAALALIDGLARWTELVWVTGNHDPHLPLPLPGRVQDAAWLGSVILRHAPQADGQAEMVGHLHPAATLVTRAGRQRRKCFLHADDRLVLPAFGSLTGGLDVMDPAVACWFADRQADAYLLCGRSLQKIPMQYLAG